MAEMTRSKADQALIAYSNVLLQTVGRRRRRVSLTMSRPSAPSPLPTILLSLLALKLLGGKKREEGRRAP